MSPTRAAPSSRLLVGLCRLVTAAFYRRVEVAGAELVPRAGPLVVVANHYNSLADVVLLQSSVPRLLHPLASRKRRNAECGARRLGRSCKQHGSAPFVQDGRVSTRL